MVGALPSIRRDGLGFADCSMRPGGLDTVNRRKWRTSVGCDHQEKHPTRSTHARKGHMTTSIAPVGACLAAWSPCSSGCVELEVLWTYALLYNAQAEPMRTQSVIDHAVRTMPKNWDHLGPLLRATLAVLSERSSNYSVNLEAPPGFEPGMEVLQTSALPLGDGAGRNWGSKLTWNGPAASRDAGDSDER